MPQSIEELAKATGAKLRPPKQDAQGDAQFPDMIDDPQAPGEDEAVNYVEDRFTKNKDPWKNPKLKMGVLYAGCGVIAFGLLAVMTMGIPLPDFGGVGEVTTQRADDNDDTTMMESEDGAWQGHALSSNLGSTFDEEAESDKKNKLLADQAAAKGKKTPKTLAKGPSRPPAKPTTPPTVTPVRVPRSQVPVVRPRPVSRPSSQRSSRPVSVPKVAPAPAAKPQVVAENQEPSKLLAFGSLPDDQQEVQPEASTTPQATSTPQAQNADFRQTPGDGGEQGFSPEDFNTEGTTEDSWGSQEGGEQGSSQDGFGTPPASTQPSSAQAFYPDDSASAADSLEQQQQNFLNDVVQTLIPTGTTIPGSIAQEVLVGNDSRFIIDVQESIAGMPKGAKVLARVTNVADGYLSAEAIAIQTPAGRQMPIPSQSVIVTKTNGKLLKAKKKGRGFFQTAFGRSIANAALGAGRQALNQGVDELIGGSDQFSNIGDFDNFVFGQQDDGFNSSFDNSSGGSSQASAPILGKSTVLLQVNQAFTIVEDS